MSLLHDLPSRIAAALFKGVIAKGPPGGVYLTFDDGPDSDLTPRFLQILSALDCPATFFLTGSKVQSHPEVVREIVAAGQSIGIHGFDHKSMLTLGRLRAESDLQKSLDAVELASGIAPLLFRPPYGRLGFGVLRASKNLGLTTVLWSLSGADWKKANPAALTSRIVNSVRIGDIILLHDSGKFAPVTLESVRGIIEGVRSKGLRIAPLPGAN